MKIFKNTPLIVLIITTFLICLNYFYSTSQIILMSLNFLILMEIIKTILEYLYYEQHRVKLRYVIDGAILFGIRELFVAWVMMKTNYDKSLHIIGVSIIIISILIFLRIILIKYSTDILE